MQLIDDEAVKPGAASLPSQSPPRQNSRLQGPRLDLLPSLTYIPFLPSRTPPLGLLRTYSTNGTTLHAHIRGSAALPAQLPAARKQHKRDSPTGASNWKLARRAHAARGIERVALAGGELCGRLACLPSGR